MALDKRGGAKGVRLFIADLVLLMSQELERAADRLDRLHTRLDPIWRDIKP